MQARGMLLANYPSTPRNEFVSMNLWKTVHETLAYPVDLVLVGEKAKTCWHEVALEEGGIFGADSHHLQVGVKGQSNSLLKPHKVSCGRQGSFKLLYLLSKNEEKEEKVGKRRLGRQTERGGTRGIIT